LSFSSILAQRWSNKKAPEFTDAFLVELVSILLKHLIKANGKILVLINTIWGHNTTLGNKNSPYLLVARFTMSEQSESNGGQRL